MRTTVRLIILCLFIRFPYAFCADVEDDRSLCSATSRATLSNPVICFAKAHADLMGQEGIKAFCDDLFREPPAKETTQIIVELSQAIEGDATEQTLENIRKHTLIIDGFVFEVVHQLNTIKNSRNPISLWIVSRLISVLLRDTQIPTDHTWLAHISPFESSVLEHLVGDAGVVTTAISHIVSRLDTERLDTAPDRGTNIFTLTHMFVLAAGRFPQVLLESKLLRRAQMAQATDSFTGTAAEASALHLFEACILLIAENAKVDIAARPLLKSIEESAIEKRQLLRTIEESAVENRVLQERLSKAQQDHAAQLISSREEDAARIAQLEGALGTTTTQLTETRDANTALLQRASGAEAQLAQFQSEITRFGGQVTGLRSILRGIPWYVRCCCCIPNPDDEDDVRRPLLAQ